MTAVVLAAGKSRRMGCETPKVLLPVKGRPLLAYVVEAARRAGARRIIVVTGACDEEVRRQFGSEALEYAIQREPRGTADAVLACRHLLTDDEECVVLYGDAPLIRPDTARRLCTVREDAGVDFAVFTATLDDPGDYGRVVRTQDGLVDRIVEKKDATSAELAVREVNSGLCSFRWGRVRDIIERLQPSRVSGEYYLTDVVRELRGEGGRVIAVEAQDPAEILGANTPEELALVEAELARRELET